jgi:hypothetical protein
LLSFITLVQGLGLAYAAGLDLYAAVAVTGLAVRFGWISGYPAPIQHFGSIAVIVVATTLFVVEFVATLIPGVASAWETLHSLIRPPAAAVLAATVVWHSDPLIVLVAALLGGGLAITTHTTKLGLRYAIDTSPEPMTNGVANVTQLAIVSSVAIAIWHHPFLTLGIALVLLCGLVVMVRIIWNALRQVFAGRWIPAHGFMQGPRVMERRGGAHADDDEPL